MAASPRCRWPGSHTTVVFQTSSITIFPLISAKLRSIVDRSSVLNSSTFLSCCRGCFENKLSVNGRKGPRKSVDAVALESGSGRNEGFNSSTNRVSGGMTVENGKSLNLRKSLIGKRALWRRIFFVSKRVRSIILLNCLTIIYASNIPVLKEVESIVDPDVFGILRFSMTAIPFIPFVLRASNDAHTRNAGIELGFWVSLGYIMQALGLLTSDAGRASFISMFTVIIVPLIDGMLGSIIPARTWFGALMSIIGIAMLECSGSAPCVGDLLNFLSAVFFGIHMLRTEHISRRTKRENFLPLLGYEVCTVALLSIIWYFIESWFGNGFQESNPLSWTMASVFDHIMEFLWVPALYTGIFSTGLCLWIEMAAMCDVSAAETAVVYGLEPVWGAGFAWFLLGERWGISGWIGAALVLGGSLTVQIMGATSNSLLRESKDGDAETNMLT
ncbi:uncharacterized protein LOC142522467 [Primulina tabacum]|uniref:uncharacterized protein LOC142522467 n=1 Tax=Primulina tabacum TaxID=48773 RepID=UPI003F590D22